MEASMQTTEAAPPGSLLTRREHEVLELMAFGLTNKEIASRLVVSPRTVETHIDRVLGKLNAPTRMRAVVEAGRIGLLSSAAATAISRPPDLPPHNLPFQLTALLGREQDLAEVKYSLENNRLLTLSGSGGVGKTRLALRLGIDLVDRYPYGVWLCDFSPISDPALLETAVAKVLGVRQDATAQLADSIIHALKRKHALLIFDNCEHVLDSAAELVDDVLHNCPNVRILATSRQALGIMGEVVHRLRSLEVPETVENLKADKAMRYGAIELFMDRAQAADRRFTLTNDNAPIVATICRRLDGIPLAIELAAARVNVVSISNLARSLDDRFKLLTAGGRTSLPRHKTLAALFDWSYDRLPLGERKLFDRLSIFSAGFDVSAAAAVCAGDGVDAPTVLDFLIALVEKSLVVATTEGQQERYKLLESTRAYALDKLEESGERDRFAGSHADYFRNLAVESDAQYGIGSTAAWLTKMESELENYRATLEWALAAAHDVALGAELAGALERLWALRGLSIEARSWIDAALQHTEESTQPKTAARLWLAKARFLQGEPMRDCAERALHLYRSLGEDRGAAYALRLLAYSLLQMGRADEAHEVIAQAVEAFRAHGDRAGVASCLSLQGVSAYNRGDFAAGREFYVEALSAYKSLGDELGTANVLGNLAELEFADGRAEHALRSVNEALEIMARAKYATDLAILHNNMTAYRIAAGDLDAAHDSARKALHWALPERNAWNTAVSLQHLALLGALGAKYSSAARLLGYVNVQYGLLALEREATEKWAHEKLAVTLGARLNAAEIDALAAEGANWSEDRAIEEALGI